MFFKENELILELLGVFKITRNQFFHESIDGRAYDCLGFRLEGNCNFKHKKNEYCVTTSDIIYLPNNIHYSQETEGETIISINFINYSSAVKYDLQVLHLENPDEYKNIICKMHEIWTKKEAGYKHLCTSMLYKLLYMANLQLNKAFPNIESYNSIMRNAAEYIHKNYKRATLSVSELAKNFSLSETCFRRMFHKTYSTSPMQYIINLRLEYASQLLLSRYYTIKEISDKSGFNDAKYFSRLFKKRFGCPPKVYANTFCDNMLDIRNCSIDNSNNKVLAKRSY